MKRHTLIFVKTKKNNNNLLFAIFVKSIQKI